MFTFRVTVLTAMIDEIVLNRPVAVNFVIDAATVAHYRRAIADEQQLDLSHVQAAVAAYQNRTASAGDDLVRFVPRSLTSSVRTSHVLPFLFDMLTRAVTTANVKTVAETYEASASLAYDRQAARVRLFMERVRK